MKRTEDVFEFENNCYIERKFSGVDVKCKCCTNPVYIKGVDIPDLIAALQQFQETGTFVQPKRYQIKGSMASIYYKIKDTKIDESIKKGSIVIWLTKDKAQRLADILNEEEE